MSLDEPLAWDGPSGDSNDEQLGEVVEPTTLDRASEFNTVILGELYDSAIIGRRGAHEGPEALHKELAGVKTDRFDAGSIESVSDCGDVQIPDDDGAETVQRSVYEIVVGAPTLDSRELTIAAGAQAPAHFLSAYNRDRL